MKEAKAAKAPPVQSGIPQEGWDWGQGIEGVIEQVRAVKEANDAKKAKEAKEAKEAMEEGIALSLTAMEEPAQPPFNPFQAPDAEEQALHELADDSPPPDVQMW